MAKCRGTIPVSRSTWPTSTSATSIWSQYTASRFPYVVIVPNAENNNYSWISTSSNLTLSVGYMTPPVGVYEFWQEGKCRGNQQCGKWASAGSPSTREFKYRVNNSQSWTKSTIETFFGSATNPFGVIDKMPIGKVDFYTGFADHCIKPSTTTSFKTIYKLPKAISWTMGAQQTVGSFKLPSTFYGAPFNVNYKVCSIVTPVGGGQATINCNSSIISVPSSSGLYSEAANGWDLTNHAQSTKITGVNVVLKTDGTVIVSRTSTAIRQKKWTGIVSCEIPQVGSDVSSFFKMKLEIIL